jgi:hypothetical protein
MTALKSVPTNTSRSLEVIADDIRALERGNAFAIGKLLAEAREDAEYGDWGDWLEDEFDWGPSTAANYLSAYYLGEKFPTVGDLPLPMRAVYRLGNDFKLDDPELPLIIKALTKATEGKTKPISVADAEHIIEMTLARIEYGDYPDATLGAIAKVLAFGYPPEIIDTLKAERPTTEEEAERISRTIFNRSSEQTLLRSMPIRRTARRHTR